MIKKTPTGRNRIKQDRLSQGLSQTAYCELYRLDCWWSYLSKVEVGILTPSDKKAAEWERKLKMPGLTRELRPHLKGIV